MESLIKISEAAAILNVSVTTVRRYVRRREIPYYKLKKVLRFKRSEIVNWFEGNKSKGGNPDSLFSNEPGNRND